MMLGYFNEVKLQTKVVFTGCVYKKFIGTTLKHYTLSYIMF